MAYVFVSRIILEQMEALVSMWFCTELYWYKWRPQCLGYSTKNHTGTNEVSMVYVVLHISTTRDSRVYVVLVQIESPGLRLFYKESYWYK
jgi:hypothetical protein